MPWYLKLPNDLNVIGLYMKLQMCCRPTHYRVS